MRLERLDVLPFRGRVNGARGAVETWTERDGLLLRLSTRDGLVGQGEASPLPRYSPDTLEAARAALARLDVARVPDIERGEAALSYLDRVHAAVGRLPSSAAFALETALLDLVGQERGAPLWALFDGAPASPVPLSALAGGAGEDGVEIAAAEAAARGVHTVKVKLAGPRLGRQLGALERIRAVIGERPLRLDANRTFAAASVRAEFEALRALAPELVEEPVPTSELAGLGALGVPIALDESLQDVTMFPRIQTNLSRLGCVAVVLKPMALGGFFACAALGERASSRGLDVTVSHLFDGPVALAAAAHLALAIASRSRASGLDRHGGLAAWPHIPLPFLEPTAIVATLRPGLGLAPLPVSW